jgi:multidrug resistance efflux pump
MSLFSFHRFRRPLSTEEKIETPHHEQNISRRYGRRGTRLLPFLIGLMIVLTFNGIFFLWRGLPTSLGQQMSHRISTTTVSASGLLQGAVYNLNFLNPSAQLSEINVIQGQFVRQGQVLARLDPAHFQRNIDAAQAAVTAAQHRLSATQARQLRAINLSQALIAAAKVALQTAQSTLQATNQQTQASIEEVQSTLKSDQRVLAATKRLAETQTQAAQAQLKQSLANCQTSPANGTSAPTSQNDSYNQTTHAETVKYCIKTAQTQYQQVVAEAQTTVTTAQAQVTKDQAALDQAVASAKLAVIIAQGQVATASAAIPIAANDPDLVIAAKEITEVQEDVVATTQQLCTAQFDLATQTVLIAPHDGIVTAINGTVGGQPGINQNIAPQASGSAESSVFIQLVDLSHVNQLLLNVNETDIGKVKTGQSVQFTLKAYLNRHFAGTVSALSPNGAIVNNVMTFPVIVSIAPQSPQGVILYPNMTATATIMVG